MKKTTIVNIYNFIRMSHVEPSIFIPDDFETVRNQMTLIRQYGFPATYALKYDALTEPRYQELLKTYTSDKDEISAWWEISEPLCRKAGVAFRGVQSEEFDERVNSAYSIGYTPEERRKLVDAYMEDFYQIFGQYPKTIGSWVLDTVTIAHAASKYGVLGSAICRDQMGTDGFTLWGGFPNGIYYPSRNNENIPAATLEKQLPVPMFRLLGPDPIYNFEQDVRPGLHGVYTLEPSWLIGRDPKWISWFFDCLTEEDSLGPGYAHVGQENNFLWENIKPGMEPQLRKLKELAAKGTVRIETMAESASWFAETYRLTPPTTFQASGDWNPAGNLSAMWYACGNYRVGFLGESTPDENNSDETIPVQNTTDEAVTAQNATDSAIPTQNTWDEAVTMQNTTDKNIPPQKRYLRIRDFFQYRQDYPSRYLNAPMQNAKSNFDALPVLFPQIWISQYGKRPFIRLLDEKGTEPQGVISYRTIDKLSAQAALQEESTGKQLARFTLHPDRIVLEGDYHLVFDTLPVFQSYSENADCTDGNRIIKMISLKHEDFSYGFELECGQVLHTGKNGMEICPEEGKICLRLGCTVEVQDIFIKQVSDTETCNGSSSAPLSQNTAEEPNEKNIPRQNNGEKQSKSKTLHQDTEMKEYRNIPVPPMAPCMEPNSCIFPAGSTAQIRLTAEESGEIRYTLDGSEPTKEAPRYTHPLELNEDATLSARLFLPDGRCSDIISSDYHFGIQDVRLASSTRFDPRPVFHGNGISDLLVPLRGSLDYLDGRWRGTLRDLEICGQLPMPLPVEKITVGFLSHHRAGIIYPESLELYTGADPEHLALTARLSIPCKPCAREIARQDFSLNVGKEIGAFRFVAHRYAKMPQWCCYKGSTGVFTMADNIIISPGRQ